VTVVLALPDNYSRGNADGIRECHDILAIETSRADKGIV
jgi:hypothetical protein